MADLEQTLAIESKDHLADVLVHLVGAWKISAISSPNFENAVHELLEYYETIRVRFGGPQ